MRGEGEGNLEMIAGGGGGNHFSLCSGELKMMGCAQTSFLGQRKGAWGVGEGEGNWEMIARGLFQNPPPNTHGHPNPHSRAEIGGLGECREMIEGGLAGQGQK